MRNPFIFQSPISLVIGHWTSVISNFSYSVRNASTGSRRMARREGTRHAIIVTTVSKIVIEINVAGSAAVTCTRTLRNTRLNPQAATKPNMTPTAQNHAGLNGPHDTADWSIDLHPTFNRRRFEKTSACRRLDICEQIFIGCQAVEQLRVCFGLHFRHSNPASMVDNRPDDPGERANNGKDHNEDGHHLQHVPADFTLPIDGILAKVSRKQPRRPQEECRIPCDFRMLIQETGQSRI